MQPPIAAPAPLSAPAPASTLLASTAASAPAAAAAPPAKSAGYLLALHTAAGAASGCVTKTATAPLERVKIIFQVQVCQAGVQRRRGGGGGGQGAAH